MKIKQKILSILCLVVSILIVSSTFITIETYAYDWNVTTTVTLNEHDNTGYGVINGNHAMENQYLENDYDTDLRYVREDTGFSATSMGNGSSVFRQSYDSSYYNSFNRYFYEESNWINHPTYLTATNNTGAGPNLNFTVGLNDQGELSLKSKTTLELEAEILYLFTVNLREGEFFDLNIRTTAFLTYYVYFNDVLSYADSANGVSRNVQPLFSRDRGTYFIYFISTTDNYVIMEPREIRVGKKTVDSPVASRFIQEPNQVWNESRNLFEDNLDKEAIHVYYFEIPKGFYQMKYIRFDNSINTLAYIRPTTLYFDDGQPLSYLDFMLGSGSPDKFNMYFEYDTKILIYIDCERDNTDWIEFDYIFSIISEDLPLLESGVQDVYEDDILNFGVNVEQTQLLYLNYTGGGPLDMWISRYLDEGTLSGDSYTMNPLAEDSMKIILEPGFYFFMNPTISTYDFDILLSTVNYEVYNVTKSLDLEQEDGTPDNYRLFRFDIPQLEFNNFNFTFTMPNNYTVEYEFSIYTGNYMHPTETIDDTLGNQQDTGIFQAYDTNDTQVLSFYSLEPCTRYVLIYVLDVYNNTGYSWNNYGDAFVNQTSVQIILKIDPGYPDDFNIVNLNFIADAFLVNGSWLGSYDFYDIGNDYDLYIINTTVPEFTWYKIKIEVINGTRGNAVFDFPNSDGIRPDYFRREAVWNKYYYKDYTSSTYFVNYDTTYAPDNISYEIEFGVLSQQLVFMFNVYHANLNGSISIEFIPYSCTLINPLDYEQFGVGGLSAGSIIALSIIGGLIGAGALVVVVVRVIIPRIKTKTPKAPSPPSPPNY
ncbi:MAG: hypothetical protein KAS63_01875 [Candidatus Heimdallarchaeota archaeon]|nr:hypothetical protein [Candidatus Heimdallarchaeota archaeon]MCK4954083.1 hypothetical protein [Candidatus Heimdallarchaeota archaeon]